MSNSNTSKRTCIFVLNYFERENLQGKRKCSNCLRLKPEFNVFVPFDGRFKLIKHTTVRSVFIGLECRRVADVAQKSRLLGNSALYIVSKQNDSSK